MITHTDEEVAEERQEVLDELLKSNAMTPQELKDRYLCALGGREALHTAWIAMENVEEYLMTHPFVPLDEEAFRHAHTAHTALFNLYQRIGELESEYMVDQ